MKALRRKFYSDLYDPFKTKFLAKNLDLRSKIGKVWQKIENFGKQKVNILAKNRKFWPKIKLKF